MIREHWLTGVVVALGWAVMVVCFALSMVIAQPLPSDWSTSTDSLAVGQITGPQYLAITVGSSSSGFSEMVRINMTDGSITYGPNYRPDAAAKAFWDALGLERKECRK